MAEDIFTIHIDKFDTNKILNNKGICPGGKVQLFFSESIMKNSQPYVPAKNLMLDKSARLDNDYTGIIYNTPYAHYHWYGEVYGPNFPVFEDGILVGFRSPPQKYPTGREMNYSQAVHPLAGPHWCERMWIDKGEQIINATNEYIRSGNIDNS